MNEINITLDAFNQSKGLPQTIEGLERIVELVDYLKKNKDALNFKTNLGDIAKAVAQIERLQNSIEKVTIAQQKRAESQANASDKAATKTEKENEKLRLQQGLLGGLKTQIQDLNKQKLMAKTPEQIAAVNVKLDQAKAKFRDMGNLAATSTNTFGTALSSFQFKFNLLGNLLGGLSHSLIGGLANSFHEFFAGSIHEFQEAELNANRLAFSVKNVLGGSQELVDSLIAQSERVQRESIFSDDAVQQAQTALLNYGLTGTQIERLIPKIVDLASAQKIDLGEATDITIKGISGMTKGLKTSGIQFEDTGSKTKNLAILMDKLGKFSGAAGDEMETSSGKAARFKNAMNDLQEGLGELITDVGLGVLDFFSDLGDGIGDVAVAMGIVKRQIHEFNASEASDEELAKSIEGLKKKSEELQKLGIFIGDIGDKIKVNEEEVFRRSIKALGTAGLKDAIAERQKLLADAEKAPLRLGTEDELKNLDPFQLTTQRELEILREFLAQEKDIKDDSTKEEKKTKKDLLSEISQLEIKEQSESIERQKDALKFKADQDIYWANKLIADATQLSNTRLAIEKQLAEDLAALEEKKLRAAAAIRIRDITNTYADEKQKTTLILNINKQLANDIAALHDKDTQDEVKRINEESDQLKDALDKKSKEQEAITQKQIDDRKKSEQDAADDQQKLRLLRARNAYETTQAEIENEQDLIKKQLDDLEELYNAGLLTQEEFERKREIITREGNKKLQDLNKAQNDKLIDNTTKVVDALLEQYERNSKKREENLNKQITDEEKIIDEQRKLAERGENNTLDFEKKRKAQLERQVIEEQKKQERIKTLEAFFNAFAAYAKEDPKTAAVKAFRDVVIAKLIAGRFKDGGIVEDEVNIHGGHLADGILVGPSHAEGGILIEAEGKEGFFSGREMQNFGKKNFYALKSLLQQPVQDELFADQAAGVVALLVPQKEKKPDTELLNEVKNLRKAVENIPSLEVRWDEFGNLVTDILKNGIRTITVHKGRKL